MSHAGERAPRLALIIATTAAAMLAASGRGASAPGDIPAGTRRAGAAPPFPDTYLYGIGAQPAPGTFPDPADVAVGTGYEVFVTDAGCHRLQVFGPDGLFDRLWGGPGQAEGRLARPGGVAVTPSGVVYVADTGNFRVQAFDAGGRYLNSWDSYPDPERPSRRLPMSPADVAVAPDDTILVTDSYRGRILAFDARGRLARWWGGSGTEDGQFVGIAGLSVARDGRVYVAEELGERVQYFSPEGSYLGAWRCGPSRDIAAGDGRVAVAGGTRFGLRLYDQQGTLVSELPLGAAPANLVSPQRVAFAPDGSLVILDDGPPDGEARIVRVPLPAGHAHAICGGTAADGVIDPAAVELDLAGRLCVADRRGARIQVFEVDGRHVATSAAAGTPPLDGARPVGLAVDADGAMYLSDAARHRVLSLAPGGGMWAVFGAGTGTELGQFGESGPTALALTHEASSGPRLLFVADPGNTRVQAFELQGWPRLSLGRAGDGEDQLCRGCVGDVTTSPAGTVYVTERAATQRVLAFDTQGAFRFAFQGHLGEDSRFAPLEAIDYAPGGRLYLSDPRSRIQAFAPDGVYLGHWDTFAGHPALAIQPGDIVAGTDGRLYVADRWQRRVHVFGPAPAEAWRLTAFGDAWLTGPPVTVRSIAGLNIALDWGAGAPDPALPADGFSVRLERVLDLPAGSYGFRVTAAGPSRLWVDDQLLLDMWLPSGATQGAEIDLASGRHALVLEYANNADKASLALHIALPTTPGPGRTATPTEPGPSATQTMAPPQPTATGRPRWSIALPLVSVHW